MPPQVRRASDDPACLWSLRIPIFDTHTHFTSVCFTQKGLAMGPKVRMLCVHACTSALDP